MSTSTKQSELGTLGKEWSELTAKAQEIRKRKREMREKLEPHFNAIIPCINEELKERGNAYSFDEEQNAGYLTDGPLSFDLYPNSTPEWEEKDPHDGLVDYKRSEELKGIVNSLKAVKEFRKLFPGISITITSNYCGYFDIDIDDEPDDDSVHIEKESS